MTNPVRQTLKVLLVAADATSTTDDLLQEEASILQESYIGGNARVAVTTAAPSTEERSPGAPLRL
jgi:hypothetical protein